MVRGAITILGLVILRSYYNPIGRYLLNPTGFVFHHFEQAGSVISRAAGTVGRLQLVSDDAV